MALSYANPYTKIGSAKTTVPSSPNYKYGIYTFPLVLANWTPLPPKKPSQGRFTYLIREKDFAKHLKNGPRNFGSHKGSTSRGESDQHPQEVFLCWL